MTPPTEGSDQRSAQWLRGVLDLCLLAVLADEPAYGYEMTRRLSDAGLATVADGSIYPALARLERTGLVESYRVDSVEGPPRKYYRQTASGREHFAEAGKAWADFSQAVVQVLESAQSTRNSPTSPTEADA